MYLFPVFTFGSDSELHVCRWVNPLPTGAALSRACYGAGLFVVVGDSGNILTSPNGWAWTQRYALNGLFLTDVCFGDGRFVAVGKTLDQISLETKSVILYSDDGVEWQPLPVQPGWGLEAVIYGNGRYIAVGAGGKALSSTDGISWNEAASGTTYDLVGVAYGNGRFTAVGNRTDSSAHTPVYYNVSITSTTGEIWVAGGTNQNVLLHDVYWGGNGFYAIGGDHTTMFGWNVMYLSGDGLKWTGGGVSPTGRLQGGAFGNGVHVSAGLYADYTNVFTSANGTTWKLAKEIHGSILHDVAFGNGIFVAVGDNGSIFSSRNGADWTARMSGWRNAYNLNGMEVVGDYVAAVSEDGYSLVSPDGLSWRSNKVLGDAHIAGMAFGNGKFVAVGYQKYDLVDRYFVASSLDGFS